MTAYVNRAVMEECPRTFRAARKQHQACSREAWFLSPSFSLFLYPRCIIFKRSESPRARNFAKGKEKRSEHEHKREPAAATGSQTNKLECTAPRVTVFFAVPRVERWMRVLILQCRASSRSLAIV